MKRLLLAFLASAFLLLAQSNEVDAVNNSKKYDKELFRIQKIVRNYQHLFKMDKLVIGVDVVSQSDLEPGTCGASIWRVGQGGGYGMMLVLRQDEYNKKDVCQSGKPKKDQENTVVHELLHFVIEHSPNEEMAVGVISNVIVPYFPVKIKKEKPFKSAIPKGQDPIYDDYPRINK